MMPSDVSSISSVSTWAASDPTPPSWVIDALGPDPAPVDLGPDIRGVVARSNDLLLLSTSIVGATTMPADVIQNHVAQAYQRLAFALATTARTPIRFWNFIPQLTNETAPGLDRYMVFNAGRHDALSALSAAGQTLPLSAATAVGTAGSTLVVHCLAATHPGTPVENPRQTSPSLYSLRYGPVPPWFARAVIATISGQPRLLISGTASIVGEDSTCQGNAAAQLEETLQNIASVVTAARKNDERVADALNRLIDLRVYVTRDEDEAMIRERIETACPRARRIDLVRAQICRRELLLEIEAVAGM
jgi:chorismate lyase/3-hydroxybenzoate synthase